MKNRSKSHIWLWIAALGVLVMAGAGFALWLAGFIGGLTSVGIDVAGQSILVGIWACYRELQRKENAGRGVFPVILHKTRSAGFTLIELMLVIAIITLALSLALPTMKALTGGADLATAHNKIASLIGIAQNDARYNRQTTGLFFYLDAGTGQIAIMEVQEDQQSNANGLFYPQGQPNNGPVLALTNVTGRDIEHLPLGSCIAFNNCQGGYNWQGLWGNTPTPQPAIPPPALDRYVRIGVILFDSTGQLIQTPYGVQVTRTLASGNTPNLLAQQIGLSSDLGSDISPAPPATYPLYSSPGFVLYDQEAYQNQSAAPTSVPTASGTATIGDGAAFAPADLDYLLPNQTSPSPADKFLEERWIDQNSVGYFVNPTNGALVDQK